MGITHEGMPGDCEGAIPDWMHRQRDQRTRLFAIEIFVIVKTWDNLEYPLLPVGLMRKMNRRPLQEKGKQFPMCLFAQGNRVKLIHAGAVESEW